MIKLARKLLFILALIVGIFFIYNLYKFDQIEDTPKLFTIPQLLELKSEAPRFVSIESILVDYTQIAHHTPASIHGTEDEKITHINYAFYPLVTENDPRYSQLIELAKNQQLSESTHLNKSDLQHLKVIVRDHEIRSTDALPKGYKLLSVPFAEFSANARSLPYGDQKFICDNFNWPDLDNTIIIDLNKPPMSVLWIIIPFSLFTLFSILYITLTFILKRHLKEELEESIPTFIPTKQRLYGNGVANPFKKQ